MGVRSLAEERTTRTSKNYSAAKGTAAIIVMVGHFVCIPNFWIFVDIGLLVFSISSGYFTMQRYQSAFSWVRFWRGKFKRLIPPLIIIEIFLLILFLIQGQEGLQTWQSVVNLIGMNGFLNWFHIANPSPYGAGMWFLTLLIVFYAVYPYLERLYRSKISSLLVTIGVVVLFYQLHWRFEYNHALWLTASGFFVGMYFSRWHICLPALISLGGVVAAGVSMLFTHYILDCDWLNFLFMLTIAAYGLLFLQEIKLPKILIQVGAWLSGVLLEIYLLHPYLFIKPTGLLGLNISISIAVVLLVAFFLSQFAKLLSRRL